MLKFIISTILVVQFSYAFLVNETSYAQQAEVLKSLDIDPSFMKDPIFLSMKSSVNIYKTKHFLKSLEEGRMFVPLLRFMIKEAKIPDTFLFLAMAESNFSPRAYSRAKAVGLWQFMEETAKLSGLKVNDYVDERRDPILSTEAAIKYLKKLHKRFGKWYVAAMAYNAGEGRISRAIDKAGTDDIRVLLDSKKKYIPKETRNYIRKILTMSHMSANTDAIVENDAIYLLNQGSGFNIVRVNVPGGTPLMEVAQSIGVSYKQLKEYNFHLNFPFAPPNAKFYHVYIPNDKVSAFVANFKPKKNQTFLVYEVQKGDSLYKIAQKYGIKHKVIKEYNRLSSNSLKIKQKLVIPADIYQYKIVPGDTLSEISSKFKVDVEDIMKMNDLKSAMIKPGAVLVIPYK